jgi:acetoacetyl-CoA synthetase
VQEGFLDAAAITWKMLNRRVERVADAMRSTGIVMGDRVAALIANTEQAITFCLAALSIGAIWSSISPDFGAQGILDRLIQIKPKLLFTNTSVIYNGKVRNLMPTIIDIAKVLTRDDSLANIIFSSNQPATAKVPKGISLNSFLSRGTGRKIFFKQMPFNQPAFVLYSSGTVSKKHKICRAKR